jgi:toxin ParE1/3/4
VSPADRLYEIIFDRAAQQDLISIFEYIEDRAGPAIAGNFTTKLYQHCRKLEHTPERGTRRDDLRRGLRTIGYRRRATVIVLGIYYGGRNYEDDFADAED